MQWDSNILKQNSFTHLIEKKEEKLNVEFIHQIFKSPFKLSQREVFLKRLCFNYKGSEYAYFSSLPSKFINAHSQIAEQSENSSQALPEEEKPQAPSVSIKEGFSEGEQSHVVFGMQKFEISQVGIIKLIVIF